MMEQYSSGIRQRPSGRKTEKKDFEELFDRLAGDRRSSIGGREEEGAKTTLVAPRGSHNCALHTSSSSSVSPESGCYLLSRSDDGTTEIATEGGQDGTSLCSPQSRSSCVASSSATSSCRPLRDDLFGGPGWQSQFRYTEEKGPLGSLLELERLAKLCCSLPSASPSALLSCSSREDDVLKASGPCAGKSAASISDVLCNPDNHAVLTSFVWYSAFILCVPAGCLYGCMTVLLSSTALSYTQALTVSAVAAVAVVNATLAAFALKAYREEKRDFLQAQKTQLTQRQTHEQCGSDGDKEEDSTQRDTTDSTQEAGDSPPDIARDNNDADSTAVPQRHKANPLKASSSSSSPHDHHDSPHQTSRSTSPHTSYDLSSSVRHGDGDSREFLAVADARATPKDLPSANGASSETTQAIRWWRRWLWGPNSVVPVVVSSPPPTTSHPPPPPSPPPLPIKAATLFESKQNSRDGTTSRDFGRFEQSDSNVSTAVSERHVCVATNRLLSETTANSGQQDSIESAAAKSPLTTTVASDSLSTGSSSSSSSWTSRLGRSWILGGVSEESQRTADKEVTTEHVSSSEASVASSVAEATPKLSSACAVEKDTDTPTLTSDSQRAATITTDDVSVVPATLPRADDESSLKRSNPSQPRCQVVADLAEVCIVIRLLQLLWNFFTFPLLGPRPYSATASSSKNAVDMKFAALFDRLSLVVQAYSVCQQSTWTHRVADRECRAVDEETSSSHFGDGIVGKTSQPQCMFLEERKISVSCRESSSPASEVDSAEQLDSFEPWTSPELHTPSETCCRRNTGWLRAFFTTSSFSRTAARSFSSFPPKRKSSSGQPSSEDRPVSPSNSRSTWQLVDCPK